MPLKNTYLFKNQITIPGAVFVVDSYTIEHTKKVLTYNDGSKKELPGRTYVNISVYASQEQEQAGAPPIDRIENIPLEDENFVFKKEVWDTKKVDAKKSFINSKGVEQQFDTDDPRYKIYTVLKSYPLFVDAVDCE